MNLAERSCVIIPGGRVGEWRREGRGEVEEDEVDASLFVPNFIITASSN